MPIFVRIPNKERINLFKAVRENLDLSFNKLYLKFNISRSMFFNYYAGRYDLPKNLFLNFQKIAKIKIKNYKEVKRNKYIKKEIIEPQLNESLAEVLGILNGDGHMAPINHEICVVISSSEEKYLKHIKKLFEDTFKIEFKVYRKDTGIKLRVNSKDLFNILHNKYRIPKGNKLGKLKIPSQLKTKRIFLLSYIRGIYDTDGNFFIRRKKDPVVQITSADANYLKEIQKTLIELGFNARITNLRIFIYDKEDIHKFFKMIQPANPKHLKKYQSYLNL